MSVKDNAQPEPGTIPIDAGSDPDTFFLNRLPSPYHRRRSALIAPFTPIIPDDAQRSQEDNASRHGSQSERSRMNVASPSESGTEADDEGYGLVIKALPAPPFKPRKGLRRKSTGDGEDASPPLTPTRLDNEVLRLSDVGIHEPGIKDPAPDTQESQPARSKGIRRRRAEILRRLTEGALLAISGALVLGNQRILWALPRPELFAIISHMVIVALVYFTYPFRLVRYSRRVALSQKPFWRCIRVSAAFDPATYIYPTILPPIVALSLYNGTPAALVANLVLGIAALPPHVLGFSYDTGVFSKHWALSLIPAFLVKLSNGSQIPMKSSNQIFLAQRKDDSVSEVLSLLFPLHSNIVPLLHSFTTTSLLPAELQLLSVSLINLLIVSSSPQSRILASILWLGGLGIIVICGPIIRQGVALARVPRWRLRRAGRIIQARQTFIRALNEAIRSKNRPKREQQVLESDADDDDEKIVPAAQRRLDLPSLKTEVINSLKQNFFPADEDEVRSAVEKPSHLINNEWPYTPPKTDRRRRHTLSNDPTHRVEEVVPKPKRKRGKLIQNSHFLSLTPRQATLRKWLYAAYIYFAMALLILFPIRSLVSHLALNGSEPFGWAIGYLGGNIREVRFWIVSSGLDRWINLPPMAANDALDITALGKASYLREIVFGPANTRLLICAYCLAVLAIGMFTVLQLTSIVEVDTRRKVFHGMMVAMLLPTIYIDPPFTSLALGIILAIFLILDLLRASQLPPLSKPIAYFLTPYVDGRDLRGPVVISHIFLLIGCAVPLWLSLAGTKLGGEAPWQGWEANSRDVSMVSGVVCVGMGDAAASLIGRRFGRHKWPWSGGKSLEGSVAFAVAVTTGLVFGKAWLELGQWPDANASTSVSLASTVFRAGLAATAASLMEAVLTGGNDNVVVPVVLWIYVRALRI